jgi:hypothetical protein
VETEIADKLRKANHALSRKLFESNDRAERMIAAVESSMELAISSLVLPPVPLWSPKVKTSKGRAEKALVVASDLQLGKITPSYTSDVCAERMQRYAEKVLQLTEIQRSDHPVDEARVYLLGDIVEGETIFPHQAFQIDSSLFIQVTRGAEIITNFLRTLLSGFKRLHVVGVIGNHGRIGGKRSMVSSPETNSDRLLYHLARELTRKEGDRISWHIPYEKHESAWYAVDYPFGKFSGDSDVNPLNDPHGFLLFHGDQIPGSASHSVATIGKHIYGYASGAVPEPFQYAIYGHWHTPKRFEMNKYTVWCNGSVESDNRYAQERLAAMGAPKQLLLFAHPQRGVSAEYWVALT